MNNDTLSRKIRQKWHEMRSAAKKGRWDFAFDSLDDFGDFLLSQNYEPGDMIMRIDTSQPFSRDNCYVYKRGFRKTSDISCRAVIASGGDLSQFDTPDKIMLCNRYYRICKAAKAEGVTIQWISFEQFEAWAKSTRHNEKFLVRRDKSEGYTEDNCMWSASPRYSGKSTLLTEDEKRQRQKDYYKKWLESNGEKHNEMSKRCYKNRISKMTEEELQEFRKKQKECTEKWLESNREKHNEISKRCYKNRISKMTEEELQEFRKKQKENKEKWLEANRERQNKISRKCYKNRISKMTEEELQELRKKRKEYYEKTKAKRLNSN